MEFEPAVAVYDACILYPFHLRNIIVQAAMDHLVDFICFALLMMIIATVFVGVIARYVFNASFSWTEEFASWSFVWLICAGMAAGHRGNRHITAGIFDPQQPVVRAVTRFVINLVLGYTLLSLYLGSRELIGSIGHFRSLFAEGSCYVAAVPTYVGGHLAMGWATDDTAMRQVNVATLAERHAAAGSFATRYWTPEVHKAAFALPRFIADHVAAP